MTHDEVVATCNALNARYAPTSWVMGRGWWSLIARHLGWKAWIESKGKRGTRPPRRLSP